MNRTNWRNLRFFDESQDRPLFASANNALSWC